jgi:hypothetical protein
MLSASISLLACLANMSNPPFSRDTSIGLKEALLVVSIGSVLLMLLFPALATLREASRDRQCKDNLRSIGTAMLFHHNTYSRFPSGGWGYLWNGTPARGTDIDQPGNWIFNIIQFMGHDDVRELGATLSGRASAEATISRCQIPLAEFNCAARRPSRLYPMAHFHLRTDDEFGLLFTKVARSDYAINIGDQQLLVTTSYLRAGDRLSAKKGDFAIDFPGPSSLAEGDSGDFKWPDVSNFTGICFSRSRIKLNDIIDGQSKTLMIGEKRISQYYYRSGEDCGDNEHIFSGFSNDDGRTCARRPAADGIGSWTKLTAKGFGSAHPTGINAAFCDGAVHSISYDVDREVFRQLGNRKDQAKLVEKLHALTEAKSDK